ncbi:MAG: cell division ATP-binding protein FtsE [Bdellovibrionaceae bacterium]|nr:cell division ATP-binding protein FtsE [Pseudobdellovibrionaceae bacterium]
MIEFSHLYKSYDKKNHALKDINLKIDSGEFVFLMGPSGAGKSTFFKMITAYDSPTSGKIKVGSFDLNSMKEKDLASYRRRLGIVFQDFKLLPDRTVYENVSLPLRVQKHHETFVRKRATEVLELVGLAEKFDQFPEFLSGGEQQRTAIARAIIHQPGVLIADEPTGNLDPEMSSKIIDVFEKVCAQGTTVVIATHDHELVKRKNKKTIELRNGSVFQMSL